jgi:WD40 repeat protein
MTDTDITPGPDSHHNNDSTEKSVSDIPSSSKKIENDPTQKSLAEEQTDKSLSAHPAGQGPASSSSDDATEKSLAPEDKGLRRQATIIPKGNSSTDLMAKSADTDYAAMQPPDRESFTPDAPLSFSSPADPFLEYPKLPGFEILGILGRGGMGVVYKARHQGLHRLVALKMILHGNVASAGDLARFHREAEAIARLQHPNIVQIYEIGSYQGLPFLSLEFVNGGSLGQKLKGLPQANDDAAQTVETLARAMAFAHQRGIIHRDLKPGNILLQVGEESGGQPDGNDSDSRHRPNPFLKSPLTAYQPKVVDFGLAKKLDELSAQTHSGAVMGTPSYMSPEQAGSRIKEIGPAADIYALGAILYEMLTGRPPFRAEKPMDTLRMVIQDEPVPPARLNPGAARDLETICLKCLQKDIVKRYATAQDLADDLRRFLRGAPITARPVTPTERALKWIKRRPALAAVYALLITVTLLGGLGGTLAWRWYETDSAKREIEEALGREQRALAGQKEAREELERHFYIHRINLAWRDWNVGDVVGARKNLEDCPPSRRQWEWHYLHRQVFPELLTLADNDAPLQVLFAPVGNSLLIVGKNNRVRARDASTGEELPAPLGTMAVQCVAYRADNKVLAAAGTDRTVVLQDVVSGTLLHTLRGHQDAVVHLAFSPDGAHLASASLDKTVKIWDVLTGNELATLKGHTAQVAWVAFRPDGRQIATASWDTSVRIWDAAVGTEIAGSPLRHEEAVMQVVYSPDGQRVATACFDKTVKIWDANTYAELPPLQGPMEDVNYLAFSPDGSRIAFAKRDKTVKLFDVHSGKQLFFLQGHLNEVTQVAYSPDGRRLVTSGKDKAVKVWDATASKEMLALQEAGDSNGLVYSPDGRHQIAACIGKTVQTWDTNTGRKLVSCVGHTDEVQHVAYHPSGLRLASAGNDKTVRIWDAASGQVIHTLARHAGAVTQVAFNADGTRLVSGDSDGVTKVWDADNGKELFSLGKLRGSPAAGAVLHLAFHPDGRHLAMAVKDGPVRVWDIGSGAEYQVLPSWSDDVDYLAYNPLGNQLAIASKSRGVTLWNTAPDGTGTSRSLGHAEAVVHLAFSSDGRSLAAASLDKTVTLWNATTGESVFTVGGHIGPVVSVAFSPNGRRLASASWDRTVKIWDVQTGKELLSLPVQPEGVTGVVFSPDGSQLATISLAAVKIWQGEER